MIIYRPQRGSLSASMREARLFSDEAAMKAHIVEYLDGQVDRSDIVVAGEPMNDDRTRWRDARRVCIKVMSGTHLEPAPCVGFCATLY